MTAGPLPAVGHVVLYRSRTGRYTLPAIVTATTTSLDPAGVEVGHVPALSGPHHVHLHVFTPGADQDYQEHDVAPCLVLHSDLLPAGEGVVALHDRADGDDPASPTGFTPGTWAVPAR
jgi:hypothetical protein